MFPSYSQLFPAHRVKRELQLVVVVVVCNEYKNTGIGPRYFLKK